MNKTEAQIGVWSSIIVVVGMIISGLIGNLVILILAPQQLDWQGIESYAVSFHVIQTLPQAAGIFMVIGFIGVMVSIHFYAPVEQKILSQLGIVFSAIYAAFISVNYIIVLTVVR